MPRPSKGPRRYLDKPTGKWVIRDGATFHRTGCAKNDIAGAEKALEKYIGRKYDPSKHVNKNQVDIDSVLLAYLKEHVPHVKSKKTAAGCIEALTTFWSGKFLTDIRASTCREYAASRKVGPGSIRRELTVLQAAINYWHKEYGPLPAVPQVTKPPEPPARERWMTRSEVAQLLLGALGWSKTDKKWARSRSHINRHTARFIILAHYTGTRHDALLRLRWSQNEQGGWIDLERGVLFRKGSGETESNKRQTPVRLARPLLAHLKRWQRLDKKIRWVIHYDGRPVGKMKRSWIAAVRRAGLPKDVTPHVLRHTRATWLMQGGVDLWQAAGFLGMSAQTLEKRYGHHHSDFQKRAADQK